MKLVAFDLDNTLIDGDAANELAKFAGKENLALTIDEKVKKGKLTSEDSLLERSKLLKGLEYDKIKKIVDNLPLMKGAEETTNELLSRGIKVYAISGSFDIVAEKIKKELKVDYAVGNELQLSDGKITGEVKGPTIKEGSKGEILARLAKSAGISLDECVAVGNGSNDISMFNKANMGIAFNSHENLNDFADIVITEKDLTRILPYILETDNIDALNKNKNMIRKTLSNLKRQISIKRSEMRDFGNKKRELINKIAILNTEANNLRKLRNKFNNQVKSKKAIRDKANGSVKSLLTEFNAAKNNSPKGDFKKLQKEVKSLEWKLQTNVMEIKKEDAIIVRIDSITKTLDEFKVLIKLSHQIDKLKKNAKEQHSVILELSKKSQLYHEDFLKILEKIREYNGKIEAYNEQRDIIAPILDNLRIEHTKELEKRGKLTKKIKNISQEKSINGIQKNLTQEKNKAKNIYERFKRGEKLDLDDIYLLRRFDLV